MRRRRRHYFRFDRVCKIVSSAQFFVPHCPSRYSHAARVSLRPGLEQRLHQGGTTRSPRVQGSRKPTRKLSKPEEALVAILEAFPLGQFALHLHSSPLSTHTPCPLNRPRRIPSPHKLPQSSNACWILGSLGALQPKPANPYPL